MVNMHDRMDSPAGGESSASDRHSWRYALRLAGRPFGASVFHPGFSGDRPPPVVSPAPAELQVPRREAFEGEATSLGECDRRSVAGLDVRLESVQTQRAE